MEELNQVSTFLVWEKNQLYVDKDDGLPRINDMPIQEILEFWSMPYWSISVKGMVFIH